MTLDYYMKWIGISGGWRKTNSEVERDVRHSVIDVFLNGNGIVTGGALGVDYIATDEALRIDPYASRIKVFLPTSLDIYSEHYKKRAKERVITNDQAEMLISQLEYLVKQNPGSLIENPYNKVVDKSSYYERNLEVVNASDELLAFHVNNTSGTKDTINKAKEKGIPVNVFRYKIK